MHSTMIIIVAGENESPFLLVPPARHLLILNNSKYRLKDYFLSCKFGIISDMAFDK